ncbi:hypothetical protein Lal_00048571 [Lupinus albus]|nr:hypothetical protein Lal_00048571 [Lupinus albus]
MDGAKARDLYPAVGARPGPMSRRAAVAAKPGALPTLETAQPEVGSSAGRAPHVAWCPAREVGKWIRNLGKRIGLRAGHGGPSPEPVGCRWTARAALAARAGRRVPVGGRIGNGPFGASSPGVEQSTQNWYGQGESDCLIKTSIAMVPADVDAM